jgi:hypothetical protein
LLDAMTLNREEALKPAEEAVEIYRSLAKQDDAYLHDLAGSLDTLAILVSELGRREGPSKPQRKPSGFVDLWRNKIATPFGPIWQGRSTIWPTCSARLKTGFRAKDANNAKKRAIDHRCSATILIVPRNLCVLCVLGASSFSFSEISTVMRPSGRHHKGADRDHQRLLIQAVQLGSLVGMEFGVRRVRPRNPAVSAESL